MGEMQMARQIKKQWVVIVLLWFATGATAFGLEIIYPADGTYSVRNNYIIFKGGEPAIDAFTLEIDGVKSQMLDISSPQYRQLLKDMVILPAAPPSAPLVAEGGAHKVLIEGYSRGQTQWEKVSSASAEFYYLADPTDTPPEGFERFVMHVSEREAGCVPCHDMNPDPVAMSLDTVQHNPCGKCHKRMLNKKYVHGPAGVLDCGGCHDSDTRPEKYLVTKNDPELCNGCHEDKNAEFNRNKYVHGPGGAGLCRLCHDSHGSNEIAQLLKPVNALCISCHETDMSSHVVRGVSGVGHPLSGKDDPSRPGRDLSCASCHDPHGGSSRYFFKGGVTSRFSLCQFCHQK